MSCMSLHTAGLVIGWLESVYTLLGILNLSINLVKATTTDLLTILGIILVIVVIKFICSVLLIVGTKTNRHLLLLPWIIFAAIAEVTLCGLIIWIGVEAPKYVVEQILLMLMVFIINAIISNTIFSLFKHIRTIREGERPVNIEIEIVNQNKRSPY